MKLQQTSPEKEHLLEHLGISSEAAAAYLEHQLPGGVQEALATRTNPSYKTSVYEALGHIAQQGNGGLFLLADIVRQVDEDRVASKRRVLEAMGYSFWHVPKPQEQNGARDGQMRILTQKIRRGNWRLKV